MFIVDKFIILCKWFSGLDPNVNNGVMMDCYLCAEAGVVLLHFFLSFFSRFLPLVASSAWACWDGKKLVVFDKCELCCRVPFPFLLARCCCDVKAVNIYFFSSCEWQGDLVRKQLLVCYVIDWNSTSYIRKRKTWGGPAISLEKGRRVTTTGMMNWFARLPSGMESITEWVCVPVAHRFF